jgi:hypothetical protein
MRTSAPIWVAGKAARRIWALVQPGTADTLLKVGLRNVSPLYGNQT